MFVASRKLDLAFLLMANLPEPGAPDFTSIQDIALEKRLSPGFLSQIVLSLKKAGLVMAKEGIYGGYQLSKPSTAILLSEIYEALEGPLALTTCQDRSKDCVCEQYCMTKSLWADLQFLMNSYLRTQSLARFKEPSYEKANA